MIIIITILSVFIVVFSYTTYNLLRKIEIYEDVIESYSDIVESYTKHISDLSSTIENMDKKLKEIDYKGSFESDDEVGFFFKELKSLQNQLNNFNMNNNL